MECSQCHRINNKPFHCNTCKKLLCNSSCLINHISQEHKNIFQRKHTIKKTTHLSKQVKSKFTSLFLTEGTFFPNSKSRPQIQFFISPVLAGNGQKFVLGSGTFGQVILGRNLVDNKLYAIKCMNKSHLIKIIGSLNRIYSEIDIHFRLKHDNIVQLYNCKETRNSFELIMEYANGGNLFYYIKSRGGLDEENAFNIFIQVCNAVFFLHKNNLIHRDIKPENILLFDNNKVKLCDFGWCTQLVNDSNRTTYCGTLEYMAPEVITNTNYNKSIDIWSLGVLLYELIHSYSPFKADTNYKQDIINNIKKHKIIFKENISTECKELITAMLCEDDKRRIHIEDIFKSDFVKKYEKKYSVMKLDINRFENIINNSITNNTFESSDTIIFNNSDDEKSVSVELSNSNKNNIINNQTITHSSIHNDSLKDIDEWSNSNDNSINKENFSPNRKRTHFVNQPKSFNTNQINFQRAKSCLVNILHPQNQMNQSIISKQLLINSLLTERTMNVKSSPKTKGKKIENIFLASLKKDNVVDKENTKVIYKKFKMKKYSKSIDVSKRQINDVPNGIQALSDTVITNNYISKISTKPNVMISHKSLFDAINIVNDSKRTII